MQMTGKYGILRFILLPVLVVLALSPVFAQRRITPITSQNKKTQSVEEKKEVEELLKKNIDPSIVFGDSVFKVEDYTRKKDTLKVIHKYPKLYSVTVGLNLWDPLMRAFGQKHGIADVSAEMSFYNRFGALLELGIGYANDTPDDANYTYYTPLSFYGKLGATYNFLYNGNPDYKFHAGFLVGGSVFNYELRDVSVSSDYWGEDGKFTMTGLKSRALWGELILGLKVKIVQNFFMGWNFRYHLMFGYKKNKYADVWYIPGFGERDRALSGSFSVYYTIPLTRSKEDDKAAEIAEEMAKIPEKKNAAEKTDSIR